jgi:hypothetical protein
MWESDPTGIGRGTVRNEILSVTCVRLHHEQAFFLASFR